ncbi:MAG: NYN domain-containing protein [Defluviitaleaceae bacterium]|nr:NYN domain-containing protein [Defluviitaleaceae bacterium]
MSCNTAVFYDVENLISLFNSKINRTLQLDEIHRRILELDVVKGISIQRAYADWMLQINRNLQSYVLQIGIEPVQIFNTNHHDKVKNAADVSLIIDAVELLAKHPEIENYVIASGDGIFAFLAKKLHTYGKRVIGCGFDRNTNIIFKNACDIFLTLEKNDQSLSALVKNLNRGTILVTPPTPPPVSSPNIPPAPAKPKPPTPPVEIEKQKVTPPSFVPTETKMPSKLPKNKYSEALLKANIPIWKNSRDLSGSLHVIKQIINVLFEAVDTDLENSLFKAYIEHYLPTFRSGYYGFKRFGEFMRFVVTASPYCLRVSDGTIMRITKRTAENEKAEDLVEDFPNLMFTLKDGQKVRSLFDIADEMTFTFALEELTPANETLLVSEPKNETLEIAKPLIATPTAEETKSKEVKSEEIIQEAPDLSISALKETSTKEPSVKTSSVEASTVEGSARKKIRSTFIRLSQEETIPDKEIKRLLTANYSQKTFSVTVPVFKEVVANIDMREQRMIDGKLKYWKDEFKFNGKSYLIFKEWVAKAHQAKFEAWLKKIEK